MQAFGKHVGCAAPPGIKTAPGYKGEGRRDARPYVKAAVGYRHGAPTELWQRLAYIWLIALNIWVGGKILLAEENSGQSDSEAVRAYKQFIESPPIIKSLKARIERPTPHWVLMKDDIADLSSLAAKLNQPAASDLVSWYLRTNLSRSIQRQLAKYGGGTDQKLKMALLSELNGLIQMKAFYDPQRFAGITLSPEARDLLAKQKQGFNSTWLNRLLLLDAYPREISSRNRPVSQETFIEIRRQPDAFYMKSATNLDGLADAFVRPIWPFEIATGAQPTDSMAAGWFGHDYWAVFNFTFETDSLSEEICRTYTVSNRNPVIVEAPLMVASRLMNLGLWSEKLGALRWSGNHIQGKDLIGDFFSAELQVDAQGRPSVLKEVIERPTGPDPVEVVYEYNREIKGWQLPATIRVGTNWMAKILSVELASGPQGRDAFDYRPFINKGSQIVRVIVRQNEKQKQQTRYDDAKEGMVRMAGIWLTKLQFRSYSYLLFCALTGGIVSVGVARERRKNNQNAVQTPK